MLLLLWSPQSAMVVTFFLHGTAMLYSFRMVAVNHIEPKFMMVILLFSLKFRARYYGFFSKYLVILISIRIPIHCIPIY